MILLKKLFRTMLEKKAQFLSAWLLVVISSMLFYSCTVAGVNLIGNLNQFFDTHHVEDASFVMEKPLDNERMLEEKYNIRIEKRVYADVSVENNSVLRLVNATTYINQYSVINGSKLENNNDILIDPSFAKAHNLKIGQNITLNGQSFKIKGMMAVPDYIYSIKSVSGFLKNPNDFGLAVVKEDSITQMIGANLYYSVLLNNAYIDHLKKDLSGSNRILQWVDKKDNNRISFIKGDIIAVKQMGETLPIGILLVTIVIILILLWRLLKKENVQIGTLYALGYRKKEILVHYIGYAAFLALSGSIVGTSLGWLLLHPLLSVYAAYYNLPVLFIKPHIPYLLTSLLLPLMIFLPFTYFLVRRVLRIPPVLLMKGGELKTKVNLLERSIRLRRFSFTSRFKIREILRSLPRVIFLTVGVILVTLLLLLGFVTKDSMEYLVQDNFKNVYHYKYEYVFNGLQTVRRSGDIASAAPFSLKNNPKQSIIIYGLQKYNKAIELKDMKGKKLSFDSVIINKSLADKLGVTGGDTLKVKSQLTNKTFSITIQYIANSYLGDVIYMPLKSFNQLNGYPEGSYTEIYSNQKLEINPDLLMDTINAKATVDGYKQLIQPLNYGVVGIGVAAGVIAVIIIYILISLLIDESSYKISLMKIIGYEDRSIRSLLINYNLWLVILGFLIGIPVTFSSISAFFDSITAEMSLSIPVSVHWMSVVIAFGILLVAYYLSLLLNRRKINGISMYEAIKRSTE